MSGVFDFKTINRNLNRSNEGRRLCIVCTSESMERREGYNYIKSKYEDYWACLECERLEMLEDMKQQLAAAQANVTAKKQQP